ncbi:MAG: hypothetical protein OEW11_07395 [Nitrospirota bacterium]|nr:hypothetical protein [Nitrospirota bacterium]
MGRMIHSHTVSGFLAPPAWPGVIRIVTPKDGETVDGAVDGVLDVRVDLAGAREADGFHLFVDGEFRQAVAAEETTLSGLDPGPHRIKVWAASATDRLLVPSHEIRVDVR